MYTDLSMALTVVIIVIITFIISVGIFVPILEMRKRKLKSVLYQWSHQLVLGFDSKAQTG